MLIRSPWALARSIFHAEAALPILSTPRIDGLLVTLTLLALALTAELAWGRDATGVAVISSEKDHALTLIDLQTQSVVGVINTCKRPRHLMRVGAGQVVVACGESGQAEWIDLNKRASVRRVSLGEDPEIFDISTDGKWLFVSNEEDAKVSLIDLSSGKRVGTVSVGEEPEGVLLARDGKTLYVTSEVAGVVHVVDVGTRKVIKDLVVGKRPRRLALSPDGLQLWVSNELDASVSVIDTRSHEVNATIRFELKGARASDITPVGLTFAGDGKTAFIALGNANHVAFVDVASRKTREMVLVGRRAWSLALDSTGKRLYVVNGLSDDLTIVDVAGAKPLKTLRVGRVPHSVVLVEGPR